MRSFIFLAAIFCYAFSLSAQGVTPSATDIQSMTEAWEGERSEDGRPVVSDRLLERLANISIEEAWGVLRNRGYHNQFEGDWMILNEDETMVGRAVTVQYMPSRPDMSEMIMEIGEAEGRIGASNSWPNDWLRMERRGHGPSTCSSQAIFTWPMASARSLTAP